jgi:hypothetical protein
MLLFREGEGDFGTLPTSAKRAIILGSVRPGTSGVQSRTDDLRNEYGSRIWRNEGF